MRNGPVFVACQVWAEEDDVKPDVLRASFCQNASRHTLVQMYGGLGYPCRYPCKRLPGGTCEPIDCVFVRSYLVYRTREKELRHSPRPRVRISDNVCPAGMANSLETLDCGAYRVYCICVVDVAICASAGRKFAFKKTKK